MGDIFLSYASEDRERALTVRNALLASGFSVWWDRKIPAGKTFDQVIDAAMQEARCVIVLWSRTSIAKNWVLEEAEDGLQRGVLIPVMIDPILPPRGFRRIQAADLSDWSGTGETPGLRRLRQDVAQMLGRPDLAPPPTGPVDVTSPPPLPREPPPPPRPVPAPPPPPVSVPDLPVATPTPPGSRGTGWRVTGWVTLILALVLTATLVIGMAIEGEFDGGRGDEIALGIACTFVPIFLLGFVFLWVARIKRRAWEDWNEHHATTW